MYNNSIIDSFRLERREEIKNITHSLDDSRSFFQQMITSTLNRSNSSEHHRLFEEFIVCFLYHNHRRIIHIRSLVNKSLFLAQNFFFCSLLTIYLLFTRANCSESFHDSLERENHHSDFWIESVLTRRTQVRSKNFDKRTSTNDSDNYHHKNQITNSIIFSQNQVSSHFNRLRRIIWIFLEVNRR